MQNKLIFNRISLCLKNAYIFIHKMTPHIIVLQMWRFKINNANIFAFGSYFQFYKDKKTLQLFFCGLQRMNAKISLV